MPLENPGVGIFILTLILTLINFLSWVAGLLFGYSDRTLKRFRAECIDEMFIKHTVSLFVIPLAGGILAIIVAILTR